MPAHGVYAEVNAPCPKCDERSYVIDTRRQPEASAVRRRRKCGQCGFRWTTYEIAAASHRVGKYTRLLILSPGEFVHLKEKIAEAVAESLDEWLRGRSSEEEVSDGS